MSKTHFISAQAKALRLARKKLKRAATMAEQAATKAKLADPPPPTTEMVPWPVFDQAKLRTASAKQKQAIQSSTKQAIKLAKQATKLANRAAVLKHRVEAAESAEAALATARGCRSPLQP